MAVVTPAVNTVATGKTPMVKVALFTSEIAKTASSVVSMKKVANSAAKKVNGFVLKSNSNQ